MFPFALGVLLAAMLPAAPPSRKHVLFMFADDLGWDDVSLHGSTQIPTPAIDRLASEGERPFTHLSCHELAYADSGPSISASVIFWWCISLLSCV